MPRILKSKLRHVLNRRYKRCPIECPMYQGQQIASLSDFFAVCYSLLEPGKEFWFRGHCKVKFNLAPSALRYNERDKREQALGLITDMRRYLELKLDRPPADDNDLGWMQVAQHYGLPTRLLDWTKNAAVALYFACSSALDSDGLVVVLKPDELNQAVDPKRPRVFNIQKDANIINPYFSLDGRLNARGKRTIAINPTWNTERIALQQGVFTLHGSRKFELDQSQVSSLIYIPILKEYKTSLLNELDRVGIGEMFIFPEPEHVCIHLRRSAGL
jgi:hypothetical protein